MSILFPYLCLFLSPVRAEEPGGSPAAPDDAPAAGREEGAGGDEDGEPAGGDEDGEPAVPEDLAEDAPAPVVPPEATVGPEDGFGLGALPALNYNTDEGFGYGVIGTAYWYRDGLAPYKTALTLRIFLTTRWVHAHMLRLDTLEVGHLPLRLTFETGYYSTLTANYCGLAGSATCDPAIAEAALAASGLQGEEADDFLRRFYMLPYTEPYGLVNALYRLADDPARIELLAGFRGSYYLSGRPGEPGPYTGSWYATAFPEGEEGFAGVFQAGLSVDARDNEPAPTRGYWVEGSLRGAHEILGSAWNFGGFNLTLRKYATLLPGRLVSATRLVVDGEVGDPPTMEMVRVGGWRGYSAFGGQYAGRGLRSWREIGRVKGIAQEELRFLAVTLHAAGQRFDIGGLGFFDLGYVAEDWDVLGDGALAWGTGGGLRIAWNTNFVVRADVGVSPVEDWGPRVYINLDNLF